MTQYSAIRYGKKERIENVAYYHIPTSKIDAVLSGFPLQIVVESATGFLTGVKDDDWKYLHAVSGGIGEAGRECYVEIDKWDPDTGSAVLHVKVWEVTKIKETIVKLFFSRRNTNRVGFVGSGPASRVWDGNYEAVYHFSEDPTGGAGCIKDSTSNLNNGTPDGTMTSGDLVDGNFSKALDFDGVDDVVNVPAVGSLSAWTITSLVTTDTLASEKVFFTNDLSGWNDDVLFGIDPESGLDNGYIGVIHQDSTDSVRTQINSTIALAADGTEYVVSAKADGSSLYLKVNNETTVSLAKVGTALDFGNNALQIGFSANGSRKWDGQIGELRLSKIARSEAWIKAEQLDLLGTLTEWTADGASPFGEKQVSAILGFQGAIEVDYTRSDTYCWWPIQQNFTYSNNNFTVAMDLNNDYEQTITTYPKIVSEGGKFYFEVVADDTGASPVMLIGVQNGDEDLSLYLGDTLDGWGYMANGRFYHSSIDFSPDPYTDGDIIGVAFDLTTGYLWFAKNNVWQGSGDPANGTNPAYTGLDSETYIFPAVCMYSSDAQATASFFEADKNYDPPSGFIFTGEAAYTEAPVVSEIGVNETIDGELVTAIENFSAGIGFNDSVVGEMVSSQKLAPSTFGLNADVQTDHIDESTGEVDETLGFNDEVVGYNIVQRKESISILGFNDESIAHITLRNKGILNVLGFSDEVDGVNSFNYKESQSIFGLSDTIGVNLESIVGNTHILGLNGAVDGHATTRTRGLAHTLGISDAVYGGLPGSPDMAVETFGLSDDIDASYFPAKGIVEDIGFNIEAFKVWQYETPVDTTLGFNIAAYAENVGNLRPNIPVNLKYKFYLTLTGANDSLDDVEITEIKTIQFRMKRNGESSYLGITAIYSEEKETAIDARTNGTLILTMASVYEGIELLREDLMEVDFSDVRYDIGSTSKSITINGYGVLTYQNDVVFVSNATAKKVGQDGRANYKFARPDFYVRPGYKVVYGVENFIADEIAFYVGENDFYMNIYFDKSTLSGENTNDIYKRFSLPTGRKRRFYATLTGSQDAVADYSISGIIDIQIRLYAGKRSYASLSIIHTQEAEQAIALRPNGDIVINVIDGIGASLEEFISVNFNEVSYELLPNSRKLTLVGYRKFGFPFGTYYESEKIISERIIGNGDISILSAVADLNVAPGYIIGRNGRTFIAGEVTFDFKYNSEQMSMSDIANIQAEVEVAGEFGMTGDSISNTFYPSESVAELGINNNSQVSMNGTENAPVDAGIGFGDFITAELNPLF